MPDPTANVAAGGASTTPAAAKLRAVSIHATDPDLMSERLQPLAHGVRIEGPAQRDFRARARGWRFGSTTHLNFAADYGAARFAAGRDYIAVTSPLCGSVRVGGERHRELTRGELHLLATDAAADFRLRSGTIVLGLAVRADRFDAQWQAATARWGESPAPLEPVVRTTTARGRRLASYLDWIGAELRSDAPSLRAPTAASEVSDTLLRLLVEAACSPEATAAAAGESVAKRAEELLAANLERPLSLAEVARELQVSVRTLSRALRARRGVGPIAFHRRLRLEAARRALFCAEPGETDVTGVALRFGFVHLGRFSQAYKRAFGEQPSQTLRQ